MKKRNSKQIESDIKVIKEAAKTAKSLKEVAQIMGSTYSKVSTSLAKHPIVKNRILALLEANRTNTNIDSTVAPTTTEDADEPVVTKEFIATKPNAEGKSIVICDCPAIVYGLTSCSKTPVTIPLFVKKSMIGIARLQYNTDEGIKAKAALSKIGTEPGWCTIAPELVNDKLFVNPTYSRFDWRARRLVAMACTYWAEGYDVTIKTRTANVAKLATLQGCLIVDFVPTDNEIILKSIS